MLSPWHSHRSLRNGEIIFWRIIDMRTRHLPSLLQKIKIQYHYRTWKDSKSTEHEQEVRGQNMNKKYEDRTWTRSTRTEHEKTVQVQDMTEPNLHIIWDKIPEDESPLGSKTSFIICMMIFNTKRHSNFLIQEPLVESVIAHHHHPFLSSSSFSQPLYVIKIFR